MDTQDDKDLLQQNDKRIKYILTSQKGKCALYEHNDYDCRNKSG